MLGKFMQNTVAKDDNIWHSLLIVCPLYFVLIVCPLYLSVVYGSRTHKVPMDLRVEVSRQRAEATPVHLYSYSHMYAESTEVFTFNVEPAGTSNDAPMP